MAEPKAKRHKAAAAAGIPHQTVSSSSSNNNEILSMSSMVTLSNGVKYPRVGLGMFRVKTKGIVSCAKGSGYLLFDTAKVYENEKFMKDMLADAAEAMVPAKAPFWTTASDCPEDLGKAVIDHRGCDFGDDSVEDLPECAKFQVQTKLWRTQHGRAGAIKGFLDACKNLGLIVRATPADKSAGVSYRLSRQLDSLRLHHPGPKRG